ncbi:MAG: HDOD domain-containing protein [Candidatus Latescibacterota bacterium]|nr:HDOD domain-containing protein [Candidatus Latescibacterota bacterium]
MTEDSGQDGGNPLIVIGDKIQPKHHLVALLQQLRAENNLLNAEDRIQYVVCNESFDVALALRKYLDSVKMILIGPGLEGNAITVARMFSRKAHIVMVIDPQINPLGTNPTNIQQNHKNLEHLGVIVTMIQKATGEFFKPIVQDYVLSGISPSADLESMSPEERAQMVDQRLDAVNKFPSLPETQRKVARLDDMDPPKKWAEAIDPDVPTKTVILRILNSARYGLRSRVEEIDKAVVLASAKTIREIVTACQIRQIFQKTAKNTIDQFWRHSLATAFYAKLFSLPADPAVQTSQQKTEFERYQFEEEDIKSIESVRLWEAFDLDAKDDPFTSGLLHDIGKVTMLMCLEDSLKLVKALIDSEAEEAKNEDRLWAKSVLEVERFLMKDMDHQVIGSRLAEKWEMDPGIEQVIGHHHNIHEQSPPILKLVALANLAANCIFPYPATGEQHPFPQLFARIDRGVKDKSSLSMDEAVDETIRQDVFEDLVDVLSRLDISEYLWELIDFKTFFKLSYLTSSKIKSASISFLQQTA